MADEPKDTETTDEPEAQPAPAHGRPPNILTRPTDHAARPGFRSPPNQKSKAQQKKKAGGKKRGR
jgi:hypothetical protein